MTHFTPASPRLAPGSAPALPSPSPGRTPGLPRSNPRLTPGLTRVLAVILAAAVLLATAGCDGGKIKDQELSEELSAAFSWNWVENPTKAAVDMGLLTQQEAEEGISMERLIEVRKIIQKRKNQNLWLHGFYAGGSYSQIELTKNMDSVSFGWAKVAINDQNEPFLNQTPKDGNGWYVPESSHLATDYLKENSVPYNLCVFGSAGVVTECIREENRDKTVAELVKTGENYGGITVDFEGLRGEENKENFTIFMENLRKTLPNDKKLYVCVQPLTWFNGYDYRALGEVCDKVILMAHDYQWLSVPEEKIGTSDTDTPVAPSNHVYNALRDITDAATGVREREKVVLAISFGSCGLEIDENGLLCNNSLVYPGADTLEKRLAQPEAEVTFHEGYQSPYVTYQNEEGRWFKVWFENEESVLAKLELARLFGISGLSLWRLGSIPNGQEYNVWNGLLREMEQ